MVMNGFNTNFDAEGNQVYAVNTVAFHYVNEPIEVKRGELVRIYLVNVARVRPDQLVPHPRELLRLLPDRHVARADRVHRHGHPGPGPARDPRAALPVRGRRTCSTPTRPSSPSSAGWASSRSSADGGRSAAAAASARRRVERRCGRPTWAARAAARLGLIAVRWLIAVAIAVRRSAAPASASAPARRSRSWRSSAPCCSPGEIELTRPQHRARPGRRSPRSSVNDAYVAFTAEPTARSGGSARQTLTLDYPWQEGERLHDLDADLDRRRRSSTRSTSPSRRRTPDARLLRR